jgi:hypothetical protein
MTDREAALWSIEVGDIFRAEGKKGGRGPKRVCLALSITENVIVARAIATQDILEFDRRTGIAVQQFYGVTSEWVITSVTPLPTDIHEIMLGLDRRFQEETDQRAENPDLVRAPEDTHLTKEQIRGLLFLDDFYRANPV